jgi:hypothetical protein
MHCYEALRQRQREQIENDLFLTNSTEGIGLHMGSEQFYGQEALMSACDPSGVSTFGREEEVALVVTALATYILYK